MRRVVVVGGGASGLLAAGRAAALGAEVVLLEKTDRLGIKLRLTDNERGNLSHDGAREEIVVRPSLAPNVDVVAPDGVRRNRARAVSRPVHRSLLHHWAPRVLRGALAGRVVVLRARPFTERTARERRATARLLKAVDLRITGTRPPREAMVTLGGVDVGEADPRTMGSRVLAGLFFCGEVLDVAGEAGGYNLQFASTSGWVAGESAAACAARRGPSHADGVEDR